MRMTSDEAATRAGLDRIAHDGSDLTRPLEMDFFVAVPDEASGQTVAKRADMLGFRTSVEQDDDSGEWTCYCTKILIASYEAVREIERQLDAIGRAVGGHADGFGSFGTALRS
jgi:hypothetical protein